MPGREVISQRDRALASFLRYYNRRRSRTSLGDWPPTSRVHQDRRGHLARRHSSAQLGDRAVRAGRARGRRARRRCARRARPRSVAAQSACVVAPARVSAITDERRSLGCGPRATRPWRSSRSTVLLAPPTVIDRPRTTSWTRQSSTAATTASVCAVASPTPSSARSRASTASHSSISKRTTSAKSAGRSDHGNETIAHCVEADSAELDSIECTCATLVPMVPLPSSMRAVVLDARPRAARGARRPRAARPPTRARLGPHRGQGLRPQPLRAEDPARPGRPRRHVPARAGDRGDRRRRGLPRRRAGRRPAGRRDDGRDGPQLRRRLRGVHVRAGRAGDPVPQRAAVDDAGRRAGDAADRVRRADRRARRAARPDAADPRRHVVGRPDRRDPRQAPRPHRPGDDSLAGQGRRAARGGRRPRRPRRRRDRAARARARARRRGRDARTRRHADAARQPGGHARARRRLLRRATSPTSGSCPTSTRPASCPTACA